MRILYMGTGEIGLPSLQWLVKQTNHSCVGIVTQPDRPAGRGQNLQPSPVKTWAAPLGIPILQPQSVNKPDALEMIRALDPELILVCAYGQILKPELLALAPRGCINIHASLLPRHRGAACIQAAILAGDEATGITIIQMDAGLDTGPILASATLPILPRETAGQLHDRLAQLAPQPLALVLKAIEGETLAPAPQNSNLATYAKKIAKEQGVMDWHLSASQLDRHVRAMHPWPTAFTHWIDATLQSKMIKIHRAVPVEHTTPSAQPGEILQICEDGIAVSTGCGTLLLLELQREGGKRMGARELALGLRIATGHRFTSVKP